MPDDPENMSSSEAGGQSQEPEDTQLKEIFEEEIAFEKNRRTHRMIMAVFLSLVLVIGVWGIFLGSLPRSGPDSETQQMQVTPVPVTTQPIVTPDPDTEKPDSVEPDVSPANLPGVINGKANPGFPYWASGTITYRFDPAYPCNVGKTSKLARAFKIINEKTDGLVSFVMSPDGAVSISCHDSPGVMGAGSRSSPMYSPGGSIQNATMDLYGLQPGTYECDSYPSAEMREILHILGFDDTSVPGNVLYSGTAGGTVVPCGELDAGIVNCLKNIYSNGKKGKSCAGIPHK